MTESRLPPLAVVLGIAGLIPFLGCGLGAVRPEPVGGEHTAMPLIAYSAVVLAFLGGVHWGFVLEGAQERAERERLVLGTVPALLGWLALMLGIYGYTLLALALLIAGFIGTAVVEQRGRHLELIPHGYMILRWALTCIVGLVLSAVLVVRAVGGHLMF